MPDFAIVDSHVHFYDPKALSYPWLKMVPPIDGIFLPAQLDAARDQTEIDRIVFVEVDVGPGQNIDEAAFISDLARADPRISGIVASVPLERGAAAEVEIEKLLSFGKLRGIRRLIQYNS